jgi:methyltransferase
MEGDLIGPPQIAAAAVLLQRGAEELYSRRNTRRLIAAGGREEGGAYYPVVAVTHLAWLASIFFLIPATAEILWPAAALFLILQVARYWIIATLGRYWTHRVITLDDAPIVTLGPYRFVRHPNYAVTYAETFLLPLAFGAPALAVIMTAVWIAVIRYKIVLEDRALASRRDGRVNVARRRASA